MKKLFSLVLIAVLALSVAPCAFAADETGKQETKQNFGEEYFEAQEKNNKDNQKKALQEQITQKRKEIVQTKNANHMPLRQKDAKIEQLTKELQSLKKQLNSL